jgi:hypothetical protein
MMSGRKAYCFVGHNHAYPVYKRTYDDVRADAEGDDKMHDLYHLFHSLMAGMADMMFMSTLYHISIRRYLLGKN